MSLILEALKKAERQHKLGEVPGIKADLLNPRPVGMHGLGWVMLLLFACLMLGLGLYLGGFRLPLSEAPVNPPMSQQVEAPAPPMPAPAVERQDPVATPAVQERVPALVETPPPKPVYTPPKPKPARPLSEMPSGFIAHLPSLNIDIHSYDARASKRYVLINMEKYHEGDYLAEGPLLVEILTDGVILEHLGERFILPIGNR